MILWVPRKGNHGFIYRSIKLNLKELLSIISVWASLMRILGLVSQTSGDRDVWKSLDKLFKMFIPNRSSKILDFH